MKRAMSLAVAASLLAGAAAPALAEGWSITKLGSLATEQACMDKARMVINRYLFAHAGGSIGADAWSLYAYDLEPGLQDVVIVCPIGGGGAVNPMLVVQSESSDSDRAWVANELVSIWESN